MSENLKQSESAMDTADLVGRFYAWWRGDPLPTLHPVPNVTIEPSEDPSLIATLTGMDPEVVRERMQRGHQPWLAWIDEEPAGWGWVATREAGISELGIEIDLGSDERYLWDFVTPPAWRGRGIYTALLHTILDRDGAARYWIGHDEGNVASARGITKAGFRQVGTAQRLEDGRIVFVPDAPSGRADAAASLLGLPVVDV